MQNPLGGEFSLHDSEDYEGLQFVAFEICGERHVICKHLGGSDRDWHSLAQTVLNASARLVARREVAAALAPEALALVRLRDDLLIFEADDEYEENNQLEKLARALESGLAGEDSFESAKWFSRDLGISGYDDIFYAFRDRWKPAFVITEAHLLNAAKDKEEKFLNQYPTEVERIQNISMTSNGPSMR